MQACCNRPDLVRPRKEGHAEELAIYLMSGALTVDGVELMVNTMAVLDASVESQLRASTDAHFVLIGGDAIDGHRIMSWNFVATRKELITKAAADWDADRFAKVPGETERIQIGRASCRERVCYAV